MEIFIFLLGGLIGYGVPATTVHQDCLKGDQAACVVDQKINYQPKKKLVEGYIEL